MNKLSLLLIWIVAISFIGVTGCQPKRTQPQQQETYVDHYVSYQGETLTLISAWYTGSGQNWRLIQQSNPYLNPNKMLPGTLIRIPSSLVTRSESMPQSFVDRATAKLKSSPPMPTDTVMPTDSVAMPPTDVAAAPSETQEVKVDVPSAPAEEIAFEAPYQTAPVQEAKADAPEVEVVAKVAEESVSDEKVKQREQTRDELLKELLKDY